MTRDEAIKAGLETYNTGRPCKYGHTTDRNTKTGACIECRREYYAEYRRLNSAEIARKQSEWREKHKERLAEPQRARNRVYYAKNRAAVLERQRIKRAAMRETEGTK